MQGVGGKEGEGVVSSVSTENGDASVYTIRWSDVVPKARTRHSKFLKRCSRSRRVVLPEADKRQEGIEKAQRALKRVSFHVVLVIRRHPLTQTGYVLRLKQTSMGKKRIARV